MPASFSHATGAVGPTSTQSSRSRTSAQPGRYPGSERRHRVSSTILDVALDGRQFEDEVRRVARARWPQAEYDGAANVEGREYDGVFETDDVVHFVECTTWRTKDKAEKDIGKLAGRVRKVLSGHRRLAQGWFITASEPTADQRSVTTKYKDITIRVLSFDQFRAELIDGSGYLRDRTNYGFGSARDPETGSPHVRDDYVPVDLLPDGRGDALTASVLATRLAVDGRVVLLGDYGAGKSMTLRAIFMQLANEYRTGRATKFPIHINLRDHQAQSDPTEALERHARRIGFPRPDHLVRAWRAGDTHLLLDGFDEIATQGWAGPTKRLRDLRRRAVELVRQFIRQTPRGAPILVAGREHFFDSRTEMVVSLGVEAFSVLRLGEFSDEQLSNYLARKGWAGAIPSWIPSRPLLLSYLASRGLLAEVLSVPTGSAAGAAWNQLLDRICEREAEIEAGIDGHTVRRVLERLATVARQTSDGLGPLLFEDISGAFTTVCGYNADDRGMVLLQRLPGLGVRDPETGSRQFVDATLADTARAGDVVAYIADPFGYEVVDPAGWFTLLDRTGIEVAAGSLQRDGVSLGKVKTALDHAAQLPGGSPLAADIARISLELGYAFTADRPIYIAEAWIPEVRLDDARIAMARVEFQDCVIDLLDYPADGPTEERLPTFRRCAISHVLGRASHRELPPERFLDCDIDHFEDEVHTTNSILQLRLPLGSRVTLTVLKKLYMQRGVGRKENALFRGLDSRAKTVVPGVLALLQREGLTIRTKVGEETVWQPVRGRSSSTRRLLESPTASDPLLAAAARLE